MAVQQPAGVHATINGLIPKVQAYLQNRSDVSESASNPESRPSAWIRDTLREVTANFGPFEELRIVGPMVTIGPGLGWAGSNYMYEISTFLNPGDDYTKSWDPVIFYTATQAQQAGLVANNTNVVARPMDRVGEKAIQSILFIPGGVPSKYCRFGNMFWFGTQPGQNYNMYLPYQKRHPFADQLIQSKIYVPEDWHDIIAIAA